MMPTSPGFSFKGANLLFLKPEVMTGPSCFHFGSIYSTGHSVQLLISRPKFSKGQIFHFLTLNL